MNNDTPNTGLLQALMAFGSRIRPSPFFQATLRWGASAFTTYNHTFMPSVYKSAVEDYHHLTTAVTLWDVAGERQVEISGKDASRFVQYLTPRNLSKTEVGQCRYVLITNQNGGVINDPVLLRIEENKYWLSAADSDILLWCQGVAIHAGYDVNICQPDVSPLQLQGPKSLEVAIKLFGDWVSDIPYFRCRSFDFEGVPLIISRTGWSGERGFEIYLCNGEYGDWLWEKIMKVGEPFGIEPATPSTIRRVEGGLLSYGADANDQDTPYHLGLERLVDLSLDSFIGKSALQQIAHHGINRRLVGIEIDGDPLQLPLVRWWDCFDSNQQKIGKVRSAVYSPTLQKNIGFAMLYKPHSEYGTPLQLTTEYGDTRSAITCSLPFIKTKTS